MLFPNFVWIVYEWHEEEWWRASQGDSTTSNGCSDDQIKKTLDRALIVSHHPVAEEDTDNVSFNVSAHIIPSMCPTNYCCFFLQEM